MGHGDYFEVVLYFLQGYDLNSNYYIRNFLFQKPFDSKVWNFTIAFLISDPFSILHIYFNSAINSEAVQLLTKGKGDSDGRYLSFAGGGFSKMKRSSLPAKPP